MKLGSIALLMIAMLSPASFRGDIRQPADVIPSMEVKTKWIRALEDSDVVLDGRIEATLKKGMLVHPEYFNRRDMDVTLIGEGSFEMAAILPILPATSSAFLALLLAGTPFLNLQIAIRESRFEGAKPGFYKY